MRIYLDNCYYNRHHDKKVSDEITQDKNAVIAIQKEIIKKNIELATSFMLHYRADDLSKKVESITNSGIKTKDAYHIASAILA